MQASCAAVRLMLVKNVSGAQCRFRAHENRRSP
jgi:hypothetical protein